MKDSQPYLSGLHEIGNVTRTDFARLYMPHTAPDDYRLLWLMAVKNWKPTPDDAVKAGFPTLRDTVRHLRDESVRFRDTPATRYNPYSGNSSTRQYELIPDPENWVLAYGLLLKAGFIEHPPHPRGPVLAKVA